MKPILMNTKNVKAILDNRKTVTRRLIKKAPVLQEAKTLPTQIKPTDKGFKFIWKTPEIIGDFELRTPYQVGDVLYVRETWGHGYYEGEYIYKASDKLADLPNFQDSTKMLYRPSRYMPKEAARIFLRVTNVRVERLKEITITELIHDFNICKYAIEAVGFEATAESVWNSTIKKSDLDKYGWEANPWVWVIEFERISQEEALEHDKC